MKLAYFKYTLAYIPPITVFLSLYFGGYMSFFAPVFIFVLIPLIELFTQRFYRKYGKKKKKNLQRKIPFSRYLKAVWCRFNTPFSFIFCLESMTPLCFYGKKWTMLSFGMACGALGINAAHELGHSALGTSS